MNNLITLGRPQCSSGTFHLPATRVEAMYFPEMLGEWPNAAVTVER